MGVTAYPRVRHLLSHPGVQVNVLDAHGSTRPAESTEKNNSSASCLSGQPASIHPPQQPAST